MNPILYTAEELSFTSEGIGRIPCTRCRVTEERNGVYECEFDVPITAKIYPKIKEGCVVASIHDDTKTIQPFDIYGRSAPMDGVVTFYAHHISYRLANIILKPYSASTCAAAIAGLKTYSANYNPFEFMTDKVTTGSFSVKSPVSVKAVLGGSEGSILDIFGKGEYEWDRWTVRLRQNRGADSGVEIRYGKNLLDITHEIDTSSVYSAVAPYWTNPETGEVSLLPEVIVPAPTLPTKTAYLTTEDNIPIETEDGEPIELDYPSVIPVPLDLSASFDKQPTAAQMREASNQYMANNEPWIPNENTKLSFLELWQTEDYKDVAVLQRVNLCDRVNVYYPDLGVDVSMQVIRVVYDALLERYEEMELGKAQASFAETITGNITDQMKSVATVSMVAQAIDKATDLMTGGLGGHIVFNLDADDKPQEILVMDTEDISTAVNVIRINRKGIGFSTTGYNGPFKSAWTIDGSFVADFITAGTINASLIRTGILLADLIQTGKISSKNGLVYFDLDNNEIHCDRIVSTEYDSRVEHTIADISRRTIGPNTYSYGLQVFNENYEDGRITISPALSSQSSDMDYSGRVESRSGLIIRGNYSGSQSRHNEIQMQSDGMFVGCNEGSSTPSAQLSLYNAVADSYPGEAHLYGKNRIWLYTGSGNVEVTAKKFVVNGTKNRVVNTPDFNDRLLYCYETASPMFGDVGEGRIGEDGRCFVFFDPIFAETVADKQYQVFLQKYGEGECYVIERKKSCFVASGTPGLAFGWELKAKQVGYDQLRLDRLSFPEQAMTELDYGEKAIEYICENTVNYAAEAAAHITEIVESEAIP